MRLVIDRLEGNYAVCESADRTMTNIPREKLPAGAKEGDVLRVRGETIEIDAGETKKRKSQVERLMRRLSNPRSS